MKTKRIISLILAALMFITSCFVTAYAAGTDEGETAGTRQTETVDGIKETGENEKTDKDDISEETSDLMVCFTNTPEKENNSMLMMRLEPKYVRFADDVSVDVTVNTSNDSENKKLSTKTFSGSDVYAEIEFFDYGSMNEDYTSEGWEHTVMGNYPVICIPFAGDITNDNFESLRIPANTVFDEQGNGNEELTGTHLYNTKIQPFFKNKNGQYSFARRAVEKSTIRFTYCYWNENVSGTVDFYYDGELVAGNAAYFEIDSIEVGTHTITAKKCGVLLDECSFDVITEWDKAGEDLSDLGGTLLEGIVALPLLIGGVAALPLLAPVLGAILPPLGLAAIAAPILPVALLIDGIISAITWISSSFGN